ncbi:MAG: alkaline phosphatase family protein [Acidobacteriota bacterium]
MSSTRLRLAAIALLAVAAIIFSAWWFTRSNPARAPATKSVIFVGLDGVDWALLDSLMARRVMPNLARLVNEGQGGNLTSSHPLLSPLVWTTMMTGVSPLEHRILDFTRYNPASHTLEPITADERAVPAVWSMATQQGITSAVLGMWATHPAEPVNGTVVSDRFFSLVPGFSARSPASVHPWEIESWVRRVADETAASVDLSAMRTYIPALGAEELEGASQSAQPYSNPVSALRQILIETRTQARLSLELLRDRSPQLLIAYYEGTDAIGHVFAPFAPPRQDGVTVEDFDRYSRVAETYFGEIDSIIGDYREVAATSGAVLVLASDHGFHWNEGRPKDISSLAGPTAAKWHKLEGMYLIWGPNVQPSPGHAGHGTVAQVCSTLLSLLGMPPAKDLPEPLVRASGPAPSTVVDYKAAYQRPAAEPAPPGSDAAGEIEKLAALGYISPGAGPTAAPRPPWASTRTPGSFNNEGLLLKAAGETERAEEAFESALKLDPAYNSACWNLSELLFEGGRELDRADELLIRAIAGGLSDGVRFAVGRAMLYQRTGRLNRSISLLDRAVATRPAESDLWLLRGRYRLETGDCPGALSDFETAASLAPESASAHASVGTASLCIGDLNRAKRAFDRSLELDPSQPEIRACLHQLAASTEHQR